MYFGKDKEAAGIEVVLYIMLNKLSETLLGNDVV